MYPNRKELCTEKSERIPCVVENKLKAQTDAAAKAGLARSPKDLSAHIAARRRRNGTANAIPILMSLSGIINFSL